MKRDQKGRFTSETEDNKGYKFTLTFPSIKYLIFGHGREKCPGVPAVPD